MGTSSAPRQFECSGEAFSGLRESHAAIQIVGDHPERSRGQGLSAQTHLAARRGISSRREKGLKSSSASPMSTPTPVSCTRIRWLPRASDAETEISASGLSSIAWPALMKTFWKIADHFRDRSIGKRRSSGTSTSNFVSRAVAPRCGIWSQSRRSPELCRCSRFSASFNGANRARV